MRLKEMMQKIDFDRVYSYLYQQPKIRDVEKLRVKEVYEEIQLLKEKENIDLIQIQIIEENQEESVELLSEKEENMIFSTIFARWQDWLGFEINRESLKRYDFSKIVALCFLEMTWEIWF